MTQSEEMASSVATKTKSMASPEPDDELCDVAEILDHVGKANTLQYFCSFVDYGPDDNCYVQASEMNGCETLIRQYCANKDAEREEYWKKQDRLRQEEEAKKQAEQGAATKDQGPGRSLRLALEQEAAGTEREPQPAAGTGTALSLGDAFNTNTRSNGEQIAKSPLSETMEEELGAHAVSPVKTKALFTEQQTAHFTEHLRGALEASQKEWEDSERRKLDLDQATEGNQQRPSQQVRWMP